MWVARPYALFGASAAARTFATIEGWVVNPSYFGWISDMNLASSTDAGNYSHMPGFEEYARKFKRVEEIRIG